MEEAQDKIGPSYKTYQPEKSEKLVYDELYPLYRKLYFAFGEPGKGAFAEVLPALIKVAAERNQETVEAKV